MAMTESKYTFPELDGEEKLIAAIKHIASALGAYTNLTDEARRVLADLGTQLTSIAQPDETNDETISEIASLLDAVQEKVMRCEADRYMIWDVAGPDEALEYLNAVDEARKLIERLESFPLDNPEDEDKRNELQRRARDVLQNALVRLEEEFKHILLQNRQVFGPVHTPLSFSDGDSLDLGGDSIEGSVYKDCISRMSEEIVDFIGKGAVPKLRSIANLMFNSKWDRECTQAYISVRKDAFEECLFMLNVDEKLNIDEVSSMSWASWKSKIRRWLQAVKIFVRVFLASEICLCDQIFGELGSVTLCFLKASKGSILQLLDFGHAISIGPKKPERVFLILDMHEMLTAFLPDIEALYMGDEGSLVTLKYHELLRRLGDSVRAAYVDFENIIASDNSTNPKSGGLHPLSKHVMNYIKTLADYAETLNVVFKDQNEERDHTELLSANLIQTTGGFSSSSSSKLTPISRRFASLATLLEGNLNTKSKLYKNASLQHLFMMNNINYMARKVKGSELKPIFGNEWIGKHNGLCHKYAMDYERASWGSALSLFKDSGVVDLGSYSARKILIKERLRSFYIAFEENYRTQTAWTVTDIELREDLRISISCKVIPAYRSFVGRYLGSIDNRYIKYSADDLENYLLDLFEGTPKSLSKK